MILYYAVTSYHVLCCMLHKLTRHPHDKAVLYISDTHPECHRLLECVREGEAFEVVGTFPDKGRLLPYKKKYGVGTSKKKLDKLADQLCREISRDFPFFPEEIGEYNICGDQYSLGIWLIKNRIPYNFFEEGCGVYTRKYLLLENLARLNLFQHDLALHLNCMGDNSFIREKYLEFSSQEGEFDKKGCVDFSVKNILKQLEEKDLNRVLKTFQVSKGEKIKENSVLLLTQQFVNMGFLTVKEEKELYDLMLDYFSIQGPLFIKPHSSDWQGLYKQWYPKAVVFERFMPSELLPYGCGGKFFKGITVSSTSIWGLEPYLEQVVCLDSSFEDHYHVFHRYYALGQFLSQGIVDKAEIIFEGRYPKLFHLMIPSQAIGQGKKILVTNEKECRDADMIVYLNEENKDDVPQWMLNNPKKLWPAAVEIKDLNTKSIKYEFLYFYSDDQELLKKVKQTEVDKMLEYSKKELKVNPQNDKAQCLALEGMLRAVNQSVEALLKENKKLKESKK